MINENDLSNLSERINENWLTSKRNKSKKNIANIYETDIMLQRLSAIVHTSILYSKRLIVPNTGCGWYFHMFYGKL